MFIRFLALAVFALFLSACGKDGSNGAPKAVEDGRCTEAFLDEYNVLASSVSEKKSTMLKKFREAQALRTKEEVLTKAQEVRSDLVGMKTQAIAFKNRFPGVVCTAKNLKTNQVGTLNSDADMDSISTSIDKAIIELDKTINEFK